MSKLHSVEKGMTSASKGRTVDLVFETENRGYYQCSMTEKRGIQELVNEPDLRTFRAATQRRIEETAIITFYFTHGVVPQDLSVFET